MIGLGKALRWVYKSERIWISGLDVPRGTLDPEIIEICRREDVMWVTKDWTAATVDEHVRSFAEGAVSAWWLRHDTGTRQQMRKREQLHIAARDIEGVLDILDSGLTPIHLVSSAGRKARAISLPFVRPRRTATVAPTPMAQRTGFGRLFED